MKIKYLFSLLFFALAIPFTDISASSTAAVPIDEGPNVVTIVYSINQVVMDVVVDLDEERPITEKVIIPDPLIEDKSPRQEIVVKEVEPYHVGRIRSNSTCDVSINKNSIEILTLRYSQDFNYDQGHYLINIDPIPIE